MIVPNKFELTVFGSDSGRINCFVMSFESSSTVASMESPVKPEFCGCISCLGVCGGSWTSDVEIVRTFLGVSFSAVGEIGRFLELIVED